jgi:UPF0271 protein
MAHIDLNADLGEGDPYDAELLKVVSSCNIACGGHAGDRNSIAATIREALANGVTVGAHPSYPDREGFGRRSGFTSGAPLAEALEEQLQVFASIARKLGASIGHVKPHGALYTDAVVDASLASTIAAAVAAMPERPPLVGQPGTELEYAASAEGLDFLAEAFVDRAYRADGRLVPRSEEGAVHHDIERIREQAVSLAVEGKTVGPGGDEIHVRADTLCIHGDTPGAAAAARAVRAALEEAGVEINAVR